MLKSILKKIKKQLDRYNPSEDNLVWLSLDNFYDFCFVIAEYIYSDQNEKIPPFETRLPGILESCLNQPLITFDAKELYPGSQSKIAILYYLLIKNHPFQNGNKRIATMALIVFCWSNNINFEPNKDKLTKLAIMVAESKPDNKNKILKKIKKFIKKNTSTNYVIQKPKSLSILKDNLSGNDFYN